jgi:hypothetical protein
MSSIKELSAKSKDIFSKTSLSPKEKKVILTVTSKGKKNISYAKNLAGRVDYIKKALKNPKYSKLSVEEKKYYALLPARFQQKAMKKRYGKNRILPPQDYLNQAQMKAMLKKTSLPQNNKTMLMNQASYTSIFSKTTGVTIKKLEMAIQELHKFYNRGGSKSNANARNQIIRKGKKASNFLK